MQDRFANMLSNYRTPPPPPLRPPDLSPILAAKPSSPVSTHSAASTASGGSAVGSDEVQLLHNALSNCHKQLRDRETELKNALQKELELRQQLAEVIPEMKTKDQELQRKNFVNTDQLREIEELTRQLTDTNKTKDSESQALKDKLNREWESLRKVQQGLAQRESACESRERMLRLAEQKLETQEKAHKERIASLERLELDKAEQQASGLKQRESTLVASKQKLLELNQTLQCREEELKASMTATERLNSDLVQRQTLLQQRENDLAKQFIDLKQQQQAQSLREQDLLRNKQLALRTEEHLNALIRQLEDQLKSQQLIVEHAKTKESELTQKLANSELLVRQLTQNLEAKDVTTASKAQKLSQSEAMLKQWSVELQAQEAKIKAEREALTQRTTDLELRDSAVREGQKQIDQQQSSLMAKAAQLDSQEERNRKELTSREEELRRLFFEVQSKDSLLTTRANKIQAEALSVANMQAEQTQLEQQKKVLNEQFLLLAKREEAAKKLESELDSQQYALSEKQRRLDSDKRGLQALLEEHQKTRDTWNNAQVTLQQSVLSLKQEQVELTTKVEAKQRELAATTEQQRLAEDRVKQLHTAELDCAKRAADLSGEATQLEKKNQQLTLLQEELHEKEHKVSVAEKQLEQRETTLKEEHAKQRQKMAELQRQIEETHQALQDQLQQRQLTHDRDATELTHTRSELVKERIELENLRAEVAAQQQNLNTRLKQAEDLEHAVALRGRVEKDRASEAIAQLKAELEQTKKQSLEEVNQIRSRTESAERLVTSKEAEILSLQHSLSQYKNENQLQKEELQRQQQVLKSKSFQLRKEEGELADKEKEVKAWEQRLKQQEQQSSELVKKRSELLQQKDAELKTLQDEVTRQQAENATESASLKELRRSLLAKQTELSMATKKLQSENYNFSTNVEEQESRFAKLRQELEQAYSLMQSKQQEISLQSSRAASIEKELTLKLADAVHKQDQLNQQLAKVSATEKRTAHDTAAFAGKWQQLQEREVKITKREAKIKLLMEDARGLVSREEMKQKSSLAVLIAQQKECTQRKEQLDNLAGHLKEYEQKVNKRKDECARLELQLKQAQDRFRGEVEGKRSLEKREAEVVAKERYLATVYAEIESTRTALEHDRLKVLAERELWKADAGKRHTSITPGSSGGSSNKLMRTDPDVLSHSGVLLNRQKDLETREELLVSKEAAIARSQEKLHLRVLKFRQQVCACSLPITISRKRICFSFRRTSQRKLMHSSSNCTKHYR
eukprot:TRINITY_DN3696_c0_g1_i2.p1 TRINITY_DN3696_c0_g1~~TRINITY_DN3696_c0_g1_i2.p1  ORF type:complete len:1259 (+),score=420.98 TRINITY_DN3696_c0_g1_i2:28-3804(+)